MRFSSPIFALLIAFAVQGAVARADEPISGAEHWAFQPVKPQSPPAVSDGAWGRNEVDRFILAKLEEAGLTPAAPADRRTLIRRATFDLIGLPPTPEEVDAFVKDSAPDAYNRLIERLLASPQYGERWGRYWLDYARYADTNGADENYAYLNAWRYRDYVIRSFNHDKPYNRFITEQLAGDLLPPSTGDDEQTLQDRLIATGFLVLGPKMLAEQDKPKLVMDVVDEQIDTVGQTFLGLTLGCARCHDHKYDPVTIVEYYALAGIFKSTKTMANLAFVSNWNERELPSAAHRALADEHAARVAPVNAQVDELLKQANRQVQARLRRELESYLRLAAQTPDLSVQPADELLAQHGLSAERYAFWNDYVQVPGAEPGRVFYPWARLRALPVAEFSAKAGALLAEVRADADAGRVTLSPIARDVVFARAAPASKNDLATRYLMALDLAAARIRQSRLAPPTGEAERQAVAALEAALYGEGGPFALPPEPEKLYADAERKQLEALRAQLAELEKSRPLPPMAMAVDVEPPQDVPVHLRGSHLTLAPEPTPRGFIHATAAALSPPPIDPSQTGRLQLARWLTDPAHPLTARVMVNRIWQGHFGVGIVSSASNFGLRGAPPSHPQLLDWLAAEFIRRGWSVKAMHRLMMLSSTYQMASTIDPRAAESDPANRLLSRQNRRRLEAEPIRDALFAVAGNLDLTMGGAFAIPTSEKYSRLQPDHEIFSSNRRAIYIPIVRNRIYDQFITFDYVDAGVHTPQRPVTTVPQQALFLLNSELAGKQADLLAKRLLEKNVTDEAARISSAYELLFARPATAEEINRAIAYLAFVATDTSDEQPRRLTAWTSLCRVLMASNEFVYVN